MKNKGSISEIIMGSSFQGFEGGRTWPVVTACFIAIRVTPLSVFGRAIVFVRDISF